MQIKIGGNGMQYNVAVAAPREIWISDAIETVSGQYSYGLSTEITKPEVSVVILDNHPLQHGKDYTTTSTTIILDTSYDVVTGEKLTVNYINSQ